METEFKGLLHLSRAEYTTLSTTGTLTKGGQTYTFDPLGTEYVVPKEASGGGVTMDLLWENASPTSAFSSQELYLDLSPYSTLLFQFTVDTNNNPKGQRYCCVPLQNNAEYPQLDIPLFVFETYASGTNIQWTVFERRLHIYSDHVTIIAAEIQRITVRSTGEASMYNRSQVDFNAIPTKIYGIK